MAYGYGRARRRWRYRIPQSVPLVSVPSDGSGKRPCLHQILPCYIPRLPSSVANLHPVRCAQPCTDSP